MILSTDGSAPIYDRVPLQCCSSPLDALRFALLTYHRTTLQNIKELRDSNGADTLNHSKISSITHHFPCTAYHSAPKAWAGKIILVSHHRPSSSSSFLSDLIPEFMQVILPPTRTTTQHPFSARDSVDRYASRPSPPKLCLRCSARAIFDAVNNGVNSGLTQSRARSHYCDEAVDLFPFLCNEGMRLSFPV